MMGTTAEVINRPGWDVETDPKAQQVLVYCVEHDEGGAATTAGLWPLDEDRWTGVLIRWSDWENVASEHPLSPAPLHEVIATVERAASRRELSRPEA